MLIYLLSLFLGMRISLLLFHSPLSLPFILWCSVYQLPPSTPPPPHPHEMRFPEEWSPNLIAFFWMMHPGIYVLFFDVIVTVFFYFVAHLSFFFHINFTFFILCIWTGSVSFTSQLHPLHNLSHLCPLYMFDVGVLRWFWIVSMLHPTLADWLLPPPIY